MKLWNIVRDLVVVNFWWKVLSLVIAAGIWYGVASEPEFSTFSTASVVYRNLPDELEIASSPVTEVSLELRGPSGELRAAGEGNLRPVVILDMSGVRSGEHTFPIGDGNVKTVRRVHFVRAIPSEVRLEFERRLTRAVPVHVRFKGQGQNGYQVARYEVQPAQMMITGPSSHVARITAADTDPIDVSSVVGTSEFRVNAFVDEPFVRFSSSPQVAVTVTMKKQ